jgi:hypothetical protein
VEPVGADAAASRAALAVIRGLALDLGRADQVAFLVAAGAEGQGQEQSRKEEGRQTLVHVEF